MFEKLVEELEGDEHSPRPLSFDVVKWRHMMGEFEKAGVTQDYLYNFLLKAYVKKTGKEMQKLPSSTINLNDLPPAPKPKPKIPKCKHDLYGRDDLALQHPPHWVDQYYD